MTDNESIPEDVVTQAVAKMQQAFMWILCQ